MNVIIKKKKIGCKLQESYTFFFFLNNTRIIYFSMISYELFACLFYFILF